MTDFGTTHLDRVKDDLTAFLSLCTRSAQGGFWALSTGRLRAGELGEMFTWTEIPYSQNLFKKPRDHVVCICVRM